ncbi:PH domain-containing protein [Terribacillus sp. 7520-G]|uniref:PH domain-containing protein n=1 Tax=Terribacillus sp. 7520-G TaxID=2025389 RepID=UPI000BA5ECB4|nr:PH domain-containing protein [Terribacillus sp. 7520-G]PAD40155.1 hypothetical protein CHH53_03830 [Terribacillus sp. 7520-G]
MRRIKFKPRKSAFHIIMNYVTILALVALVFIVLLVPSPGESESYLLKLFVAFVFLILSLFMGWIWWGAHYLIKDTTLIIFFGPIKKSIPINEIKRIRKTKSILASTTFSFTRYEILFGDKVTDVAHISPQKSEEFLEKIKEINNGVDI